MLDETHDRTSLLERFAAQFRMQLVNDSKIPLYYQLARIMVRFIRETGIAPDDQFPSEDSIAVCFEVSQPTVGKAIQVLLDQGLLQRIRGKGTFVQEDSRVEFALLSETMSPAEQFPPEALASRLIDRRTVEVFPKVARELGIQVGSEALFLRRLRTYNDIPLLVCDSVLPRERFPRLGEEPFVRGSLYATLEERYDCPILYSKRYVEASELIDNQIAELLRIPHFSPVLLLRGTAHTVGEEPVESITSVFREGLRLASTVERNPARPQSSSAHTS